MDLHRWHLRDTRRLECWHAGPTGLAVSSSHSRLAHSPETRRLFYAAYRAPARFSRGGVGVAGVVTLGAAHRISMLLAPGGAQMHFPYIGSPFQVACSHDVWPTARRPTPHIVSGLYHSISNQSSSASRPQQLTRR